MACSSSPKSKCFRNFPIISYFSITFHKETQPKLSNSNFYIGVNINLQTRLPLRFVAAATSTLVSCWATAKKNNGKV